MQWLAEDRNNTVQFVNRSLDSFIACSKQLGFYLAFLGLSCSVTNSLANDYPNVLYHVAFKPESQQANIVVEIPQAEWLTSVLIRPLETTQGDFTGTGKFKREGNFIRWYPPAKQARMEYTVEIKTEKSDGRFDALVTNDWALLRGEDLFPSFRSQKKGRVYPQVVIDFTLPSGWTSVNTGWKWLNANKYFLEHEERALVRPKGWVIAGKLGTRKETLGNTALTISAPKGHNFRQMETLAFLGMIWPEIEKAFVQTPERLLIAGASDPMWRGGLSSPNSYFVHSNRPLVSENGSSTHLHELVHVITGIHGAEGDDWIVEGIAEYYSVELLFRAGAYTIERRKQIFESLASWGDSVKTLVRPFSYGQYSARAAVLFDQLDQEIRHCSGEKANLDDLVKRIHDNSEVSLQVLTSEFVDICGHESKQLNTDLVKPTKTN